MPIPTPSVSTGQFELKLDVTLSDALGAIQHEQDERQLPDDTSPLTTRSDIVLCSAMLTLHSSYMIPSGAMGSTEAST